MNFIILCATLLLGADEWPQFRGPDGMGRTAEKNLPKTWGGEKGENVLWKTPLVGEGHASPIVWGERVFTCTVRWEGGKPDPKIVPEHHVACYAAADGKKLWDVVLEPGPWRREDFRSGPGGGYAAPTPATDGKHVYVVFASAVMAAFDFDGKLAWRQEIKPHSFDVTIGASPVLYRDTVILFCAMANKADSRLVAFKKSDGTPAWETKLPKTGFGHSTPLLAEVAGKPQLITVASGMGVTPDAIQAFDPADGKRLWWCKGAGDASSPVYGAGIVYTDSGRGSSGTALDPAGEGDLSANVKWTAGGMGESLSSPVIEAGHVFRLLGSGEVRVWEAATGTQTERLKVEKGSTWASPIVDGNGRIYFASGGKSTVIQAGPKPQILAVNDLGDPNHASPAVAGGRLYIEGLKHLWCIGTK